MGVSYPVTFRTGTKKMEVVLESDDILPNNKKYSVTLIALKFNNAKFDPISVLSKEIKFGQV